MLGALFFAFLAAAGNAIYALGQREAMSVKNGFNFIVLTARLNHVYRFSHCPFIW